MDNIVVINDLNFKYNSKFIFNNFNLSIKRGSFTTIVGNNGSGKSTLVKLFTGLVDTDCIYIDDTLVCKENLPIIREHVCVVMGDYCDTFICDTVRDELSYALNVSDIDNRVYEISSVLGIASLLDMNPNCLSCSEKQLVSLGCALIRKPDLLILDDAFSMIDGVFKKNVFDFLVKLNRDYGTTIVNVTSDIDESLYGDFIVVIDKGRVIVNDDKLSVYKQEKCLKRLGINLPFMVDLSKRLSYYDLVDDFVFNMDDMVDLLWK